MTNCAKCDRTALALIRPDEDDPALEGRCYDHMVTALDDGDCNFLDGSERLPEKEGK